MSNNSEDDNNHRVLIMKKDWELFKKAVDKIFHENE